MRLRTSRLSEILGVLAGGIVAPAFAVGSWLRTARVLHPEGTTCQARVRRLTLAPPYDDVARRLEGEALVRLSGGLFRASGELPDVLGFAIRFYGAETAGPVPDGKSQDLLFASTQRIWLIPIALVLTEARDYLKNNYFAIAPFRIEGAGMGRFRLVPATEPGAVRRRRETDRTPTRPGTPMDRLQAGQERPRDSQDSADSRVGRLRRSIQDGTARFQLEVRPAGAVRWIPLVEIELTREIGLDQQALRFDPFNNGFGIEPRGFIHNTRRVVYDMSQQARPDSALDTSPATRPANEQGGSHLRLVHSHRDPVKLSR